MDSGLYNKDVICPVCSKKFTVTKVKAKSCKIVSKDTDFCIYYEGLNPIFYDIWVCEHCGYAAQSDKYEDISTKDAKTVKEKISHRWHERSFSGERSIDNALETFKLALFNLQLRNAKSSEIARVCIRIAWLYRLKGDERERDFLNFALRSYSEAYETEHFPAEKLDEYTCMYMIGELNRRLENYEEAAKWFSKLITSPNARRNSKLIENAREQFQLVKEQTNVASEKDNSTTA